MQHAWQLTTATLFKFVRGKLGRKQGLNPPKRKDHDPLEVMRERQTIHRTFHLKVSLQRVPQAFPELCC